MPDRDGAMTVSELAEAWDEDRQRVAELEKELSEYRTYYNFENWGKKLPPGLLIERLGAKVEELEATIERVEAAVRLWTDGTALPHTAILAVQAALQPKEGE